MTTQELYQKVINGQMTKNEFLYEIRRDIRYSNLITNTLTFDDTVNILKNKQYIWENFSADTEDNAFNFFASLKSINEEDSPADNSKALKKVDNDKTEQGEKNRAKKQSKKDIDHVNYNEFQKGFRIEYAKTDNYQKAREKVLKNLQKDELFYTHLEAGVKKPTKRTDLYKLATKENFVDKDNGMKPIKKGEKMPASALKKKLNENYSNLHESINDPDYKFYVVDKDQNKIISGWEYKDDAVDVKKDALEVNRSRKLGIYSLQGVKSILKLDPNQDSSWGHENVTEAEGASDEIKKYVITTKSSKLDTGNIIPAAKGIASLSPEEVSLFRKLNNVKSVESYEESDDAEIHSYFYTWKSPFKNTKPKWGVLTKSEADALKNSGIEDVKLLDYKDLTSKDNNFFKTHVFSKGEVKKKSEPEKPAEEPKAKTEPKKQDKSKFAEPRQKVVLMKNGEVDDKAMMHNPFFELSQKKIDQYKEKGFDVVPYKGGGRAHAARGTKPMDESDTSTQWYKYVIKTYNQGTMRSDTPSTSTKVNKLTPTQVKYIQDRIADGGSNYASIEKTEAPKDTTSQASNKSTLSKGSNFNEPKQKQSNKPEPPKEEPKKIVTKDPPAFVVKIDSVKDQDQKYLVGNTYNYSQKQFDKFKQENGPNSIHIIRKIGSGTPHNASTSAAAAKPAPPKNPINPKNDQPMNISTDPRAGGDWYVYNILSKKAFKAFKDQGDAKKVRDEMNGKYGEIFAVINAAGAKSKDINTNVKENAIAEAKSPIDSVKGMTVTFTIVLPDGQTEQKNKKIVGGEFNKVTKHFEVKFSDGTSLAILKTPKGVDYKYFTSRTENFPVKKVGIDTKITQDITPSIEKSLKEALISKIRKIVKESLKKKVNEDDESQFGVIGKDQKIKLLKRMMNDYNWYWQNPEQPPYYRSQGAEMDGIVKKLIFELGPIGVKIFNAAAPRGCKIKSYKDGQANVANPKSTLPGNYVYSPDAIDSRSGMKGDVDEDNATENVKKLRDMANEKPEEIAKKFIAGEYSNNQNSMFYKLAIKIILKDIESGDAGPIAREALRRISDEDIKKADGDPSKIKESKDDVHLRWIETKKRLDERSKKIKEGILRFKKESKRNKK